MKQYLNFITISLFILFTAIPNLGYSQNNNDPDWLRHKKEVLKLPANERKIPSVIRKLINKMESENARQNYSGEEIVKRYSTKSIKVDKEGRISLEIEFFMESSRADVNAIVSKIKKADAKNIYTNFPKPYMKWYPSLTCNLPYDKVKEIAKDRRIARFGTNEPPRTWSGNYVTEGDVQLAVQQARSEFNVNGTDIKVGVISDGIQGYVERLGTELPSSISSLDESNTLPGSEGLAMMEIVYDLAPGVSLDFASANLGNGSPDRVAQSISSLRAEGCKVIVDDVWWPDRESSPPSQAAAWDGTNLGSSASSQ